MVGDCSLGVFFDYVLSLERKIPFNKPSYISDGLENILVPKNIERFADLISVSAGVLGVILGLFYTAFLTLISTKYSNISNSIRSLVIDQKAINKYFKLLTLSTSLSILFQLTMSLGYIPSIVSCLLFTYLIVVTLNSFIVFGKYSLLYFDSGNLIMDILSKNYLLLDKIRQKKDEIDRLKLGAQYLGEIYQNLITIEILIRESIRLQTSASFTNISKQLREFLIYFNLIKHVIPTSESWHLKRLKIQKWVEAKDWDHNLLKSTGVSLFPQQEIDYDLIEKRIFEIQFIVFKYWIDEADKVQLVVDEHKYLGKASMQMNISLISDYFNKLRGYIEARLSSIDSKNERFRYNLIVTYTDLIKSFLAGFNHYHPEITNHILKSVAEKTFKKKEIDIDIPYFLRKWHDEFIAKLDLECKIEGKVLTPPFYSYFEISNCYQKEFQNFWKEICSFFIGQIQEFSKSLEKSDQKREALTLYVSSIEVAVKMQMFTEGIDARIAELNDLNFQSEQTPFIFQDIEKFKSEVGVFKESCTRQIINLGLLALNDSDEKLPDTFGTSYSIVREELMSQLLSEKADIQIIKGLLPKYLTFAFLYLKKIIVLKNLETMQRGNRVYPILRDVMDIVAISIIIDKLQGSDDIINSLIGYADRVHKSYEDEFKFWDIYFKIYKVFSLPSYVFSNSSHTLEMERSRGLIQYLKSHKLVQTHRDGSSGSMFTREKFLVSSPDVYLKALISYLETDGMDRINLDQVFIEYFLRTRIALKELNIKETEYGRRIREIMGETT